MQAIFSKLQTADTSYSRLSLFHALFICENHILSNLQYYISRTLENNKIVDHSDVVRA